LEFDAGSGSLVVWQSGDWCRPKLEERPKRGLQPPYLDLRGSARLGSSRRFTGFYLDLLGFRLFTLGQRDAEYTCQPLTFVINWVL
jgi:hypothetical protein